MTGSISSETSIDVALHSALKFHNERLSIINEDPSSRFFLFWFVISCYFPVITACLGPIANTLSIACVLDRWREYTTLRNGEIVQVVVRDAKGIFAVNILSLIFGFVSNIVLILHFQRKLTYLKSQIINITGWSCAGGMLLIDVIVCSVRDIPSNYHRTIGFWFACITSGLYLGCAGTLTLHFIGFKKGKYPATFNLLTNERSIIIFTVLLSLWLIWGAGMFSGILGISWANALYFCTVSILTVGFGDILPSNVAAKVMILIFSISGVLLLGLIVFMTRSIIQKSSGPIFYFHRLEKTRAATWKKVSNGELKLSNKESFELMTYYMQNTRVKEHLYSLINTTIVFMMFWLLGAMVFHFAEGWSYFDCIYFCFLCLLTIGYGSDFSPKTGAGRAFFVAWAIGAVPLMGAILSTLGDILFDFAGKIDSGFAKKFGFTVRYMFLKRSNKIHNLFLKSDTVVDSVHDAYEAGTVISLDSTLDSHHDIRRFRTAESDPELSLGSDNVRMFSHGNSINYESSLNPLEVVNLIRNDQFTATGASISHRLQEIKELLSDMKKLHELSLSDSNYSLNFQQWTNLRLLHKHSLNEQNHGDTLEESNFWLSDYTPLRFPLNEPHYAFNRLFTHVEREIGNLLEEQREEIISRHQQHEGEYNVLQSRRSRAQTIQSLPIDRNRNFFQCVTTKNSNHDGFMSTELTSLETPDSTPNHKSSQI